MSLSSVLLVLLAVALLAAAGALLRSSSAHPWRAIGVAMLTAAVLVTIGGDSSSDSSGPSLATVLGSVVGFLSVVAAILALVPRDPDRGHQPSRVPLLMASGGILLGAVGLLLVVVTG